MGANMQCNSYFPGYYSTRNLKMDANGSTWPLNYDDKTLKSEYCYSGIFLPLSPAQVLGYNKEVLKQTMLKHETIFRDQVYLSYFVPIVKFSFLCFINSSIF